jgi:hypothetical protein
MRGPVKPFRVALGVRASVEPFRPPFEARVPAKSSRSTFEIRGLANAGISAVFRQTGQDMAQSFLR